MANRVSNTSNKIFVAGNIGTIFNFIFVSIQYRDIHIHIYILIC